MAKKVVQTAAVHVAHLTHLSSRTLISISHDFAFPDELINWLADATQAPGTKRFGSFIAWRGRWPMIHPVTGALVGTDITIIFGDRRLAIFDPGDTPWITAWMKTVTEQLTDGPVQLARSLATHLGKSSAAALADHPRLSEDMRRLCVAAYDRLATDWMALRGDDMDGYDALLVHSLRHADRLLPVREPAVHPVTTSVPRWARLASGYAVLSGIALLVILFIR